MRAHILGKLIALAMLLDLPLLHNIAAGAQNVEGFKKEALNCDQTNLCVFLSGTIEYTTYPSPAKSALRVLHRNYEIYSSGQIWRLNINDPDRGTNSQQAYWEIGTDGSSVFAINAFNTNYNGAHLTLTPQKKGPMLVITNYGPFNSVNKANGQIVDGQIPFGLEGLSLSPLLWLAFCSGCYLQNSVESNLPPIYAQFSKYAQQGILVPVRYELSQDFPHLPRKLEFLNPGFVMGMAGKTAVKVPVGFAFTNMVYEATGRSNILGWEVPVAFTMSAASPDVRRLGSKGQYMTNEWFASGKVHQLKVIRVTNGFLPEVPFATKVADRRGVIGSASPESYYISNNWPSKDTVDSMRIPENEKGSYDLAAEPKRRRFNGLPIFVGLTILILATTTWPWLRKQLKKGRNI